MAIDYLIYFKTRKDIRSYTEFDAVECFYHSEEMVKRRAHTIIKSKGYCEGSVRYYGYLRGSLTWEGVGIQARFLHRDGSIGNLQFLADILS